MRTPTSPSKGKRAPVTAPSETRQVGHDLAALPAAAMNERDAARYVNLSVVFLQHARCNGALAGRTAGPPFVKIGARVLYLREDLDAWLRRHRRDPEAPENKSGLASR